MGYDLTPEIAKKYSQRGRQASLALYRIEGESVTVKEIASRTGLTPQNIRNRISRLRKASGPITWDRLTYTTGSVAGGVAGEAA